MQGLLSQYNLHNSGETHSGKRGWHSRLSWSVSHRSGPSTSKKLLHLGPEGGRGSLGSSSKRIVCEDQGVLNNSFPIYCELYAIAASWPTPQSQTLVIWWRISFQFWPNIWSSEHFIVELSASTRGSLFLPSIEHVSTSERVGYQPSDPFRLCKKWTADGSNGKRNNAVPD